VIYVRKKLQAVEVDIDREFKESVWVKLNLKGNDKLGKLLGKSSYPLNSISALFKVYLMFFGTTSVIAMISGMFSSDRNQILNSSILFKKLSAFVYIQRRFCGLKKVYG
jgi:ABC-type molybdate transport system ATPase subunit